jgi:hypothetical protein
MKTKEKTRMKMTGESEAFQVDLSGTGLRMEEVSELILPDMDCSTFFDFSSERTTEFCIEFHVPIANQIAPPIKIIPKIVRMFLVKNDSIFFCRSLFGLSSSRGRLEYL